MQISNELYTESVLELVNNETFDSAIQLNCYCEIYIDDHRANIITPFDIQDTIVSYLDKMFIYRKDLTDPTDYNDDVKWFIRKWDEYVNLYKDLLDSRYRLAVKELDGYLYKETVTETTSRTGSSAGTTTETVDNTITDNSTASETVSVDNTDTDSTSADDKTTVSETTEADSSSAGDRSAFNSAATYDHLSKVTSDSDTTRNGTTELKSETSTSKHLEGSTESETEKEATKHTEGTTSTSDASETSDQGSLSRTTIREGDQLDIIRKQLAVEKIRSLKGDFLRGFYRFTFI